VANRRPGLAPWLPPLACVVAIAWLFSASLFGGKALSAADLVDATAASSRAQLLAAPVVEGLPSRTRSGAAVPARIVRDEPARWTSQPRRRAPGSSLDYPGWSATVDGRDAAIHPANGAFRGVRVPAGAHSVRFAYEPDSVLVGAIVSALAWLALVAALGTIAVRTVGRRRRP
jgi:hypothetical protein